ncbi:MAG: tryptophan--tRNA ligase [Candidatus Lokiarchaeota archaeon]|nr:tryptophan--tRNA ligase [Candidatus Lokiarchaeota archaeon]MBD3200090.1 tryptophan--tRNA ligase [Candidatus Lokiarchaeota archaeon]
MKIDPWSSSNILEEDYLRLIEEFGIETIKDLTRERFKDNKFIRRKVIFGHRDLGIIYKAIEEDKPWAVMSGIKPSGPFHLGTMTTALEIVEFQKMGAKAYYGIADIESWEDNGIPYDEAEEFAVDNMADILALGLNPDKAYIWRQSEEPLVKDVCFKVSRLVTQNMLNAIYGEKTFGLYLAALVQVGDILLPQVKEGPQPTVIPVGIDQDPHIRLTRDLTRRYYKEKKEDGQIIQEDFFLPGATYHKLLPGLDGSEKMSKRFPNSYFTFNESLDSIEKKIRGAMTGGRKNKEMQEELGGEPQKCMIYKILMYLFEEDDEKLAQDFEECIKGELLCGEHKRECVEKVLSYVKEHRKRKEKLIDKAREILKIE